MADAALELEQRVEGKRRQLLQFGLLGSKSIRDDALGGAVQPDIGDCRKPVVELGVEIVEIAEAAAEEEVLADVAEWPLDLALGLGAIRPAGPGQEAVVLAERHQGAIVDDVALTIFTSDRRLHAVVEDLDRYAADGVEGQHVTAQQRLQVLMHDEACDDVPGMAEHHREQPDDPDDPGLVGKGRDEAGEVDLRLIARRCLKADLERLRLALRPDRRHESLHGGVGPLVATFPEFAGEPDGTQIGEGRYPLAQVIEIGRELARPADLTWPIGRRLEPAFDVFAHRLRVPAGASRDRRDR
jgi:hypothetical protein